MRFIKTTLIGGVIFLIPVIVLILVLGKAVQLIRLATAPISRMMPMDSLAGVAMIDLLTLLVLVLVCFAAGMLAKSPPAKRLYHRLDEGLQVLPGYAFIKSFADHYKHEEDDEAPLKPVLVRFDDFDQLCFEVERLADGRVVVFVPGAPDPWSGSLVYLTADRVAAVALSVPEAISHLRRLGQGASRHSLQPLPDTSSAQHKAHE
ncbi:MAG: DUF502 domain-containing protein [Halopseudomonas sp.]|uniref:DUF502 domain-containing protein n=1 Tax=Halopseudomonas sp. TaxID=2901191 RepID=UPI003002BBC1